MQNGGYPQFEDPNGGKKKYKINYNRLISFIMVLVIAAAGIGYFLWQRGQNSAGSYTLVVYTPTPVPSPSPEPTPVPSPTPYNDAAFLDLRPSSEEGYLPVFYQANTDEKIVALTIDDCSSEVYVKKVLELGVTYGVKFTFFPTGEELANAALWQSVYLAGHEIENHTNANKDLFTLNEADMAAEIDKPAEKLNDVLGLNYEMHFLRPARGKGSDDIRTHRYLIDKGYKGFALWSLDSTATTADIAPGQIIVLPATKKGVSALETCLKYLAENEYQAVTMNQLFGYLPNVSEDVGAEPDEADIPDAAETPENVAEATVLP